MAKMRCLSIAIMVVSFCGWLWAGEVVGKVAVLKPDHVVVYIENVPGSYPATHAKIDQQGKVFTPFVLPVVQGSTVEFHNSDNLAHNVMGVGGDEFVDPVAPAKVPELKTASSDCTSAGPSA